MNEEKPSPQMQGTVNLMGALMGLTLAMKQKFGDEASEVTQTFVEKMGMKMRNQVMEKAARAHHKGKTVLEASTTNSISLGVNSIGRNQK